MQFHPMATFTSLKGVPFISLTRNSLNPQLVIHGDCVEIKVIRSIRLPLAELGRVATRRFFTHEVIFEPKQGWRTFSAMFSVRTDAVDLIRLLQRLGIPLDRRALALIAA